MRSVSLGLIVFNNRTRALLQSCKCLPIFDPKNVTSRYHHLPTPDLSPPDYFLLPKLKMKLKGLHFGDVAEIQESVTDELKKVKKEFSETMTAQKHIYEYIHIHVK